MWQKYQRWIDARYPDRDSAWLRCTEATEAMTAAFPELRRVRGHVTDYVYAWNSPHWWCETPDGEIVDPTRRQYEGSKLTYIPLDESNVPQGRCVYCGELYYTPRDTTCSEACSQAMVREMGCSSR